MTPVTSKRQSYDLWQSGGYGNKLRAWRTLGDWRSSGFSGRVVLRELGKPGGKCAYALTPFTLEQTAASWLAQGVPLLRMMVNEEAPDQHVIVQGELWTGGDSVDTFEHSFVRAHMRDALEADRRVTHGLETRLLLRSNMTPSSYEDLQVLIDRYPAHVIELSVYSCCVGDIPGRNTLVWEIRRY